MRLIVVLDAFPLASHTFIVQKTLGLIDAGFDVHVVCRELHLRNWIKMPLLAERDDMVGRVHPSRQRDPRAVARAAGQLASEARRDATRVVEHASARLRGRWRRGGRELYEEGRIMGLRPDLVHFEFATCARARLESTRLLDVPVTTSVRGFDVNYVGLDEPRFYDGVWDRVSAVHCLGQDLWERALSRGCPQGMPRALISPSVDTEWFVPFPTQPRPPNEPVDILSVGRLHWKKGFPDGLDAIAALVARGARVHYTIIGDGPDREEIEAHIDWRGLQRSVTLTGWMSQDRIRRRLATADLFLHPAVSEGFGNAVLEAQAMGVPVVCTDADGLEENVVDGRTGLVVPRRDAEAMADALLTLIAEPQRRAEMGAAGRQRAEEMFRPEDQIAAFVNFYEGVASGEPHRFDERFRSDGTEADPPATPSHGSPRRYRREIM